LKKTGVRFVFSKVTMRKQVFEVALALALTAGGGCHTQFDVGATRASYVTSPSDPGYQQCVTRVLRAQESFNTHARWWFRSVVAGIVLGSVIGVMAIATFRDTPGDGAATAGEAIDRERGVSSLELTTAALAAGAGADAAFAWYTAANMGRRAREVADHLVLCPPRSASSP